jgi:hypothetical protein
MPVSASSESHNGDEEDELEQKIKFFFQRIEKEEIVGDFAASEPHPTESTCYTTSVSKVSSLDSNLGKRSSL